MLDLVVPYSVFDPDFCHAKCPFTKIHICRKMWLNREGPEEVHLGKGSPYAAVGSHSLPSLP